METTPPAGGDVPALLLIADISGFTRFMRLHALATSHARQIVARLLRTLVAEARPPLRVAELEGDAVFFYAPAPGGDLPAVAAAVKPQILHLFRVFQREVEALARVKACVCGACTSVADLRLKQVAHCGAVGLERIDRFDKLFGFDVIVVHRMLKNSVPAREYLMLSDPAYAACADFYALAPEHRTEAFEGVGEVGAVVFYDASLAGAVAALPEAPPPEPPAQTLRWKLRMHGRTLRALLGWGPPADRLPV
ncbi:MAG: DUF2652 domain-containing protein [Rhodothermales bacterium]|nr:DUF2652 domain-containing protein [Rhodothermales bacterium]